MTRRGNLGRWVHADACPTGRCTPDPVYWYPGEAPWWCACEEGGEEQPEGAEHQAPTPRSNLGGDASGR